MPPGQVPDARGASSARWAGRTAALRLLGPAYVVAIAYVDPGNFAVNFAAGAAEGYALIWVVVLANVMAALVQYLASRLGAATGRDLCEVCRDRLPRPVVIFLWAQAELACMATDLAEIVGAAVALQLLFGVPLLAGGVLTGALAFAALALARDHQLGFERAMAFALAAILGAFAVGCLSVDVRFGGLVHGLVPRAPGGDGVLLAAGIVGATVMPHAVYSHSALARRLSSDPADRGPAALLRAQRYDVISAMTVAGISNVAILAMAAVALAGRAGANVTLQTDYRLLAVHGPSVAIVFGAALLVAGLSSSGVGTYAGQVVMRGFLRRSVPLPVRRLVTIVPALAVLGIGFDPTRALIVSQVALSFAVPFAIFPLVLFTMSADVMGKATVSRPITAAAAVCALAIVVLNVVLLGQYL
jgi:manganese transport protein